MRNFAFSGSSLYSMRTGERGDTVLMMLPRSRDMSDMTFFPMISAANLRAAFMKRVGLTALIIMRCCTLVTLEFSAVKLLTSSIRISFPNKMYEAANI